MSAPPTGDDRKHVFDDPANVRKLLKYFYIGCVVTVVLELALVTLGHLQFPWEPDKPARHQPVEQWFGFYPAFALVGVIVLVLVAKLLLRPMVMRNEDYYGDD
jgi:hypothetical protein